MTVPSPKTQGVALIEIIVGIAVLAVILVTISLSITTYVNARGELLTQAKTTYLAEEGVEIMRAIRDEDWNDITAETVDTVRYLDVTDTTLAIGGTPEVIDTDYSRSVVLRELYRNSDDDVVPSTAPGASTDPESRIVEVSVTGPDGTVTLTTILSNVHNI